MLEFDSAVVHFAVDGNLCIRVKDKFLRDFWNFHSKYSQWQIESDGFWIGGYCKRACNHCTQISRRCSFGNYFTLPDRMTSHPLFTTLHGLACPPFERTLLSFRRIWVCFQCGVLRCQLPSSEFEDSDSALASQRCSIKVVNKNI